MLRWYRVHARDLPWRAADCSPWGVLVSEVMLQQTPVARVLPAWRDWMARWPVPAALAAEPAGEAVRAWGRLGYPRRALRLHEAARVIVERHGGDVPRRHADLLALPGVGSYTAAAVASFAFGGRHVVLDTNVRRVFARAVSGVAGAPAHVTVAEIAVAQDLLPDDEARAAEWAAATMELGAVICTARSPGCPGCPLADRCRWSRLGRPAPAPSAVRRRQGWEGTDRQVRGRLLAALRAAAPGVAVSDAELAAAVGDEVAADRRRACLTSLVDDGLAAQVPGGYTLPGVQAAS